MTPFDLPPREALGFPLLPLPTALDVSRAPIADNLDPMRAHAAFRQALRTSASLPRRLLALLDDAYRTDQLELLDRDDIPAERRERLIAALDRFHRRLGTYPLLARLLAPRVPAVAAPRVLEIASGHGQLAIALERLLTGQGRRIDVLGSDYRDELVELARRNALQAGSSARFERLDALRLELEDDAVDLAFNALVMHHLSFAQVVAALTELRRVAKEAVIVDLVRTPLLYVPGAAAVALLSGSLECMQDGLISLRKAWGAGDWRLAVELSGWERARLGYLPPMYSVVHLAR